MSFNIFEAAKSFLNNELVTKAGSFLGENNDNTQKAVDSILPAIVGSLIQKSATADGANSLHTLIEGDGYKSGVLNTVASYFNKDENAHNSTSNLLSSLFGNKLSGVTNIISQFAGVKNASASSLISLVAPVLMGLLGKHTANTGVSGLSATLNEQKGLLNKYVPQGLGGLLSSAGLGSIFDKMGHTTQSSNQTHANDQGPTGRLSTAQQPTSNSTKWLMPLLLALLAAAAIWYFTGLKGCNSNTTAISNDSIPAVTTTMPEANTVTNTAPVVATAKGMVDSLSGDFVYDLGKMVDIDLPNGAGKINVGEYSTEARLINFLNDKNAMVDTVKGNWFEFTNVKFKTGGAEISEASLVQLKNMVMIAKAYPTAQFKIGGYTDNTGNAASNVVLSQKRADAVSAKLAALGAATTAIVSAKGYGGEWPIADNATAEGRAMNRRVAVNVKAK